MKVTHSFKSAIIYVGIIELKSIGEIEMVIDLYFNILISEAHMPFEKESKSIFITLGNYLI